MSKRLVPSAIGRLSATLVVLPAVLCFGAAPAHASFPGANGKIAFVTNKDGNDEIYAINPDGTGAVDLTNDPSSDIDPAWAAGGGKIAFSSDRAGDWNIYVMNADGSGQVQLTNSARSDRWATWSPDGKRIAYRSNAGTGFEIHVMNADGSGDHVLAADPGFDSEPSWSPDGKHIAFVSDRGGSRQVYVMTPDGTAVTLLTSLGINRFPSWSPDGTRIAFVSDRDGNEEIYLMDADGQNQTRLTDSSRSDRYPVYSPDGTKIMFRSALLGQRAIFVMRADGNGPTQITDNSARDIQPSWQDVAGSDGSGGVRTVTSPAGTGSTGGPGSSTGVAGGPGSGQSPVAGSGPVPPASGGDPGETLSSSVRPATGSRGPLCTTPTITARLLGPARVTAGRSATWSVQVRNTGRSTARQVLLSDMLPTGFSLLSSSRPYAFRSGALLVRLPNLAGHTSVAVKLTLRASQGIAGRRANVATVSAACGAIESAKAPVRVEAQVLRVAPAVTG